VAFVAGDWHLTRNLSVTLAALRKGSSQDLHPSVHMLLPLNASSPSPPQTPVLGNFFFFGLYRRILANSNPS